MIIPHLTIDVHDRIASLRAIERLIKTDHFTSLYNRSNEGARELIETIIYKGDLLELQRWMKNHPLLTLEELTIRQLHVQARLKCIKSYAKFSKEELVKELKNNPSRVQRLTPSKYKKRK
jgi:hypothetical protein